MKVKSQGLNYLFHAYCTDLSQSTYLELPLMTIINNTSVGERVQLFSANHDHGSAFGSMAVPNHGHYVAMVGGVRRVSNISSNNSL